MSAFVMPESEWVKLCKRQCRARRKLYGNDRDYCAEHGGICPECAGDAAGEVPEKYRTTDKLVTTVDLLPGMGVPRGISGAA